MNKTINIKEIKENNGWFNITTVEGQEIAVNSASNPILKLSLEKQPITLELNVIEKNGKLYGWDIKEPAKGGGFKQLTPEQIKAKQDREDATQRMIIAQSSISSSVAYYQQRPCNGSVDIIALANDFYNYVILKSKEQ